MFSIIYSPEIIWAIIGVIFLIFELLTLTFILCFLSIGAFAVSITTWLGITNNISGQLAVFSITSILTLLVFRKTARKHFAGNNDVPPVYVGELVNVKKAIPTGGEGTIIYRGSDWIAFSDHSDIINEGDIVEIVAIEGIRVRVKPISK